MNPEDLSSFSKPNIIIPNRLTLRGYLRAIQERARIAKSKVPEDKKQDKLNEPYAILARTLANKNFNFEDSIGLDADLEAICGYVDSALDILG